MLRALTATLVPLLALVAWGCSSADDEAAPGQAAAQISTSGFRVTSPNFQERVYPRVRIPKNNTCLGENRSPSLDWSEQPEGTKTLALIAENVDHHTGVWVLWVLYNIPAGTMGLPEGISTSTEVLPDGTTQGTNDNKNIGYNGPCPPPNIQARSSAHIVKLDPPHRYFFRLYALDAMLDLAPGATKAELLAAIKGHILGQTDTMGKYQRPLEKARLG